MKLAGSLLVAAFLLLAAPVAAQAVVGPTTVLPDGTHRTTYKIGPINITSGQNRIVTQAIKNNEKPAVDGWITRIKPDLVNEDGSIPSSSKVMFHHGVWINQARGHNFFATGEEKTITDFPDGYGYRYKRSDGWLLNHMVHNLVVEPMSLYVTYQVDFIPDTDPRAASTKEVSPIWMDVENGIYPVFDVYRDSGGPDGEFTYPQDAKNPYPGGGKKNERIVTRDGVLLNTTGHVHTGGLDTELFLRRQGAKYGGPTCERPPDRTADLAIIDAGLLKVTTRLNEVNRSLKPNKQKRLRKRLMRKALKANKQKQLRKKMARKKFKVWKRKKQKNRRTFQRNKQSRIAAMTELQTRIEAEREVHQACVDTQPEVKGNRVRLFQSKAHYFDGRDPVSWDMAMYTTKDDWRVQVKAGDILELQTTYETKIASWYESMGINIVYWSAESNGRDPYVTKVDGPGELNHGHYEENNDHGGEETNFANPVNLPDGPFSGGPFIIGDYSYSAGDFRLPGAAGRPPVVRKGQSFTFQMKQRDLDQEIWHSLTSCKAPCNKSTGISYPLPDGEFQFDSGQLGNIGAPTVGRTTWSTPANLPVGTHTY
ncbi:MAG: hypothetical protein M3Y23_02095, partial [Actinomycetota bacterium]|nr:hypothetical protein [Actinomycetota bacterium]